MPAASRTWRYRACCGALASIGLLAGATAAAQTYPTRPITVIVGYAPGGGLDSFCRMMSTAVSARLGQPLVVQNRPGADGNIGLTAVAQAAPDGYTLSCVPHSMTQAVHMRPIDINILKDLAPVARLVTWHWNFLVRADNPAKTWPEFVAYAKAKAGQATFGTSGASARLTVALLEQKAGVSILPVPYTGTGPTVTALLGGHIDATVAAVAESLQHVRTGNIRALAVLAPERVSMAPDLPAIGEYYPGFDPSAWYGVVAPAATPKPIIDRLHAEFIGAVNDPAFRKQLTDRGWYPRPGTPQQFGELIRSDYERYGPLIKQFNIK